MVSGDLGLWFTWFSVIALCEMDSRGHDTGLGGFSAPGNNPPAGLNPSAPVFTPGGNPDPLPSMPNVPGQGGPKGPQGIPHPPDASHRPTGDPFVPGLGLPQPVGAAENKNQKGGTNPEG